VRRTLEKGEKLMEKYIRSSVQFIMYSMVAVLSISLVYSVVNQKLKSLNDLDFSSVSTIKEYRAELKDRERKLMCMTKNVYWEAASEPAEGKLAVAQVVMNRVESGKFPADPCQVIMQKNVIYEKVLCQFSWYCEENHKSKPVHQKLWNESMEASKMVLVDGFRIPELKDALYYHADYVNPQWNKKKVTKIGRHIFYKDI